MTGFTRGQPASEGLVTADGLNRSRGIGCLALLRWVTEPEGLFPTLKNEANRLVLRQEQSGDSIDSNHQPVTPARDRRHAAVQALTLTDRCPLFQGMRQLQVRRVILLGEVLRFQNGQKIMRRGESGGSIFVLLRGNVTIQTIRPVGIADELKVASFGQAFGLAALMCGKPRVATAIAEGDAEVLVLDWSQPSRTSDPSDRNTGSDQQGTGRWIRGGKRFSSGSDGRIWLARKATQER